MVLFHNNVIEYVKSYLDLDSEDSIPDEYMEEIQYILDTSDEYDAVSEIRKFSSELINFDSFFEYYSCTSFTYHYIWCCYAIQWAIEQYDKYDNKLKI